jgi:hypothetical protein
MVPMTTAVYVMTMTVVSLDDCTPSAMTASAMVSLMSAVPVVAAVALAVMTGTRIVVVVLHPLHGLRMQSVQPDSGHHVSRDAAHLVLEAVFELAARGRRRGADEQQCQDGCGTGEEPDSGAEERAMRRVLRVMTDRHGFLTS